MSTEYGRAAMPRPRARRTPSTRTGTTARLAAPGRVPASAAALLAALLAGAVAAPASAIEVAGEGEAGTPFSFETLEERMRERAARPPREPDRPASFLDDLQYEDYRDIHFRAERERWSEAGVFRVQAFHMGWLFEEAVRVHEVVDGIATEMRFSTEDFAYTDGLDERVPAEAELPGVAGFKLNAPLNAADKFDEVISFVGASYFRALGRDDVYGLSARGLAIDTGLSGAEEFPRFTEFWLERPGPADERVTVYAALESESVTGAYRFVVHPGAPTTVDVTARLFFRRDVRQLGVAPLTSMYLFGENDRRGFDDFRPEVHDSDGLVLVNREGERFWRPLGNPAELASAYLASPSPRAFGLHQRDRESEHYQDPPAAYERRPSLTVKPSSDWGAGQVRLVEIPSDLEINDNVVAFWIPDEKVRAGDEREFAYRLEWGREPVPAADAPSDALARVVATRTGQGGAAGVPDPPDSRKFVVDFEGGLLGRLPVAAEAEAVVSVVAGEIEARNFSKLDGTDRWRLVLDVAADPGAVVELTATVEGFGRTLSETWLYQWIKP